VFNDIATDRHIGKRITATREVMCTVNRNMESTVGF
jgi:hypothetical protein